MLYIVRVWDEGKLYEYEYGCIEHALKHIEIDKGCSKLYRYCAGVETPVDVVAETTGSDDSGDSEKQAAKPPFFCKRNR